MNNLPIEYSVQAGPCIVCGLRDYPLSFGGPTICPACDCGNTGPRLIAAQKRRIEELEALVTKLQEPPPCRHTTRHGRLSGDKFEEWCTGCGKKIEPAETFRIGQVLLK